MVKGLNIKIVITYFTMHTVFTACLDLDSKTSILVETAFVCNIVLRICMCMPVCLYILHQCILTKK